MKGEQYPDEWVIRGNHHDGWVNGAADPVSGLVAEMEEARVIGELAKKGMKPRRTIVFCAWDGEEPALLGSTEWVEDHADELQQKTVAYLNSDGNSRGFVGFSGSHALEQFFNEIATDVTDPQTGVSISDRRYSRSLADANSNAKVKMMGNKYMKIGALGAGSDYSPFFQHLGIPSANIGFGGEGNGGEYHSIYDSYDHFTKFKDPGFKYGSALAKTTGRAMMRLANADILPFEYGILVNTISEYMSDLKSMTDQMRVDTDIENKLIKDNIYDLAKDPTLGFATPKAKGSVPYLDFSKIDNAMVQVKVRAELLKMSLVSPEKINPSKIVSLNKILFQAEQQLLFAKGLPRRPWYKHMIYAPGFYTGYGVKTMPAIREGIEERNWKEAQEYIEIVGSTLMQFSESLQRGVDILK
jgi:N-acetylated-alpha-linked acidic dipeptidase